jgi:hypothetical protein
LLAFQFDLMSGGVLTHYISLDTELYFWDYLTGADAASEQRKNNFRSMIAAQWHWLVADLKRAAESGKYAWIIAYGHRPLYCSNVDDIPDCTVDAETLRKGPGGMYGFEAAFASVPGALDIYFAAHEHSSVEDHICDARQSAVECTVSSVQFVSHARSRIHVPHPSALLHMFSSFVFSYERTYPVFQGVIDWGSVKTENLYVDPKVPTYIIAGSAGCREVRGESSLQHSARCPATAALPVFSSSLFARFASFVLFFLWPVVCACSVLRRFRRSVLRSLECVPERNVRLWAHDDPQCHASALGTAHR